MQNSFVFQIGSDNASPVDLGSAQVSLGVGECSSGPDNSLCPPGFCTNGGQCQVNAAGQPTCLCPLGFVGTRCTEGKSSSCLLGFVGTRCQEGKNSSCLLGYC